MLVCRPIAFLPQNVTVDYWVSFIDELEAEHEDEPLFVGFFHRGRGYVSTVGPECSCLECWEVLDALYVEQVGPVTSSHGLTGATLPTCPICKGRDCPKYLSHQNVCTV